ncbi:MAG: DUF4870 domain-containing protein [Ktedonobacterales bacterium]
MTDSAAGAAAPVATVALRDGGDLALFADRAAAPRGVFPLADITGAYVSVAPGASPLADGRPAPAIALRLRDGSYPLFTPADPPDAARFVEALYQRRPDLRPPAPGYGAPSAGYAYPGAGAPGYPAAPGYYAYYGPPQPAHPSGVPDSERILAGITHLSVFFASIIMPLIVWLAARRTMPYASRQGKQAFFFQLILTIVTVIAILPIYVIFFVSMARFTPGNGDVFLPGFWGSFAALWLVVAVLSVVRIGFGIYAAIQAFNGRPYHYPLLGGL